TFATDAELAALDTDDADADPVNEIQNINEVLTEGNNAGGLLIKNIGTPVAGTDAANKDYVDNVLTASNPIKAYGTVTSGGYLANGVNGVVKNGTGRFTITLTNTRGSVYYPIQLTHVGTGAENVDIFISNQTTTTFSVSIVQNGIYVDRDFYFTILDY
ncbi:hypothetical protein OO010_03325, partial [Flavobacteriaceae bacterium KMM 6898]|nr:hypothetical protein [Flavobacteriaceae bacterium KMM 6898]